MDDDKSERKTSNNTQLTLSINPTSDMTSHLGD